MKRPAVLIAAIVCALVGAVASAAAVLGDGPPLCRDECATAFTGVGGGPFGVARGPIGSEWFGIGNEVVRIDEQGRTTAYPVGDPAEHHVGWVTTAADGAIWFCERDAGKVGRIDAAGRMREYPLPNTHAIPQGIVFAPDGNVYITEQGSNAIARLNPTTGAAVDLPVPTSNSTTQSGALGPDGAIWFIERAAAKVGRMTLDGHFTEYVLAAGSFPNRIVTGPDGALWFTELLAGKIGRITTRGELSEYPVSGGPVGITVGKDGALYVVQSTGRSVARVELDGVVTGEWTLPGARGPLQIAQGHGLDLWVTDTAGNNIYRLTPYATGR